MQLYTNTVWDYLEDIARETGKPYLVTNIVHAKMIERYNQQQDREQMKKEIIEEVLARIAVKVDTGEAIQEMKGLNKELEKFEKLAGGGH